MNLCVIPARGGSKRIPRKNIKDFCGKPMIAWSIEVAKASTCFDHIIVSTDDDQIASIAKQWGAEVPFVRPAELADDYTGTIPVIAHAINWMRQHGQTPEQVCCLYATAPFISAEDLRTGKKMLAGYDYAFSITSYAFPIQRAIRLTAEQTVAMFHPEHFNTRSQDLEDAYHDAGQFYWGAVDAWLEERMIFGEHSAPIILPRHRVQDIDTAEDWLRAEWLFKAMQAKGYADQA